MTRAVIYARFSTDLQNEKSTEDQVALHRAHAARRGLDVVQIFEDKARSGGSVLGRDGLMHLMEAARTRAFDVVIVEALDRLSRDMEDLAGIHKRLSFLGIEIDAVHDGTADSILVGIRGLIGQMQREDGAKKVRRGMAGVVRGGRHAGGQAYGYRVVPGRAGELTILEEEAQVVRRIFAAYAEGRTPREIAFDLNRDGIAPPRGTRWNASTINGNAQRGAGIIFNELYVGRIVWNKVRMVKDPDTGKRISRPNARDQWHVAAAPQLRIIDDDTWARVHERKSETARQKPHMKRRPAHLLSGLLRCGCCGSGMSVHDRDKTGKTRIRCSAIRESGNCANRRIVYLRDVEKAVLDGMREASPTDDERVKAVIRGARRTLGTAPRKLAAATSEKTIGMSTLARSDIAGTRDRAILLLGFALAARRSELVALDVSDIQECPEGLRVTIRKSKTDQEGAGATIAVCRGSIACPVAVVKEWLAAARIAEGPVFRSVRRGGHVTDKRLSAQSVNAIVKKHAGKLGLNAGEFGAHSLRAGFLTSAAARGASVFKMMDVSRHRSMDMLRGYVRDADAFRNHAGAGLL